MNCCLTLRMFIGITTLAMAVSGCSFMSDVSHAVGDFSHGMGDAFENQEDRQAGRTETHDFKGNARRTHDYKSSSSSATASLHSNREEVKAVQQRLQSLGYDPGVADGVMGNKTRSAIKSFQDENELPMTGTLDAQTKAALK